MLKHTLLAFALVAGCDKGASNETLKNGPGLAAAATVTLTSVAFADDCGGTPPNTPPPMPAQEPAMPAKVAPPSATMAPGAVAERASDSLERRRCEQTAMQLAISASKDTDVAVKSVEVFDEKGASVGVLTASKPTRWSVEQSAYQAWDGKVAAGQNAQVSFVLSQPTFVGPYEERDRTFTVKVIASVGGLDQPLQTTVMVVARPAAVPT
jgi:Tfp pilus assembly major pilin PilA